MFQWFAALGPFGVRLRSDGLFDRQLSGSLFVPWEALDGAVPGPHNMVLLSYRAEAAVRRGWRVNWHALSPTTDAAWLADAINSAVRAPAARS